MAVAWLIAIVLPLQGLSAAAASAAGALHVHAGSAVALPVLPPKALVDLRRAFAAPTRVAALASPGSGDASEWRHAVGHLLPQRHVHSSLDATAVDVADPLAGKQPASSDFQSSIFIAIVPSITAWIDIATDDEVRASSPWAPTTSPARLPDRPPRAA